MPEALRILKHHEIDKSKWDDCIENSSQSIVYALSWYLDIVAPKWEAIVISRSGRYHAIMPVPTKRKLGIKFVYQPFFCQQLGIFSRKPLTPSLTDLFLKAFFKSYFYAPFYSFNSHNKIQFSHPDLKIDTRYTHYLSLDKGYDQLFKNFRRDRKYRIKQARKLNTKIERGDNIEDLITIFRSSTAEKIQGGVKEKTYDILRNLYHSISKRALGEIYYIYDEQGEPECGAWFVTYGNKIIYLFNASTKGSRFKNGRSLILDYIIRKYQGSNYVLDFESPEKSEIASFYLSFGSESVPFQSIFFNNSPALIKKLHQLKMAVQKKLGSYEMRRNH